MHINVCFISALVVYGKCVACDFVHTIIIAKHKIPSSLIHSIFHINSHYYFIWGGQRLSLVNLMLRHGTQRVTTRYIQTSKEFYHKSLGTQLDNN